VKSLRVAVGEEVKASDGHGSLYRVEIRSKGGRVRGRVVGSERVDRDDCDIEVAVGLGRSECMKWIVEKGTELGVRRIVLLETAGSQKPFDSSRQRALVDRLRRISVSAMKQSKRVYLPLIDLPSEYENYLGTTSNRQVRIVLDEKIDGPSLTEVLESVKGSSYTVLVGPESGLDENERNRALEAGFIPVSLGRARLRVETAALTAISAIKCVNGAW